MTMVAPDTPVVRFRWERLLSMPCDINPIVIAVLPWEPTNQQQQQQHQQQVENQQINQSNTVEQQQTFLLTAPIASFNKPPQCFTEFFTKHCAVSPAQSKKK